MSIRIGIAGWIYPNWRGKFYPKGLTQKKELEYAASKVSAIEINGTFYSMKKPADFAKWSGEVPRDFVFTLKGPRFITHVKKLKDVETAAANFFASGVLRLEEKLGAILWQFPPQLSYTPERFGPFLELLPRDFKTAAELGERHNDKLKMPAWLDVPKNRPLRHAVEVRHDSFLCEEFVHLLRKHDVALVIADSAGRYPAAEDVTADSSISACTVPRISTPAAMARRNCRNGPQESAFGTPASSRRTESASLTINHGRRSTATSLSSSTTTPKSTLPSMPSGWRKSFAGRSDLWTKP